MSWSCLPRLGTIIATVAVGGALLCPSVTAAGGSTMLSGPAPSASPVPARPDGSPSTETRAPDEELTAGTCRAGVMADSVCVTRDIAAWRGVAFTPPVPSLVCSAGGSSCPILMDIYAPTAPGPWPLVVVVPGGGMASDTTKSYIDDFALEVADRGAVVMTAEWRQYLGYPKADPDVACAVGVARQTGAAYGADPTRVVLVGHSDGVWPVVGTGLAIPPLAPAPGSCDTTAGSLRPDAMMVIAGLFDLKQDGIIAAGASPDDRIPVVVAQGGADEASRVTAAKAFQALLVQDGWGSTLVEVPTADHPGILYEKAAVDALMRLASTP
jgi:hypothetical protein